MPSPFPDSAPFKPSCSTSVRLARYTGSLDTVCASADGQTWVVLGDVHGRIRRIKDIPELEKAAGVILTGDLTTLGGVAAARHVIEAIEAVTPLFLPT